MRSVDEAAVSTLGSLDMSCGMLAPARAEAPITVATSTPVVVACCSTRVSTQQSSCADSNCWEVLMQQQPPTLYKKYELHNMQSVADDGSLRISGEHPIGW